MIDLYIKVTCNLKGCVVAWCALGYQLPLKPPPLFLAKPPQKKLSKAPFLGNPPSILVFREPPAKNQIFQ